MSFPAFHDYKESGIAWVGVIPTHWDVKQLKWLFDLQKRPVREEDEIVTAFRDGIVTLRRLRRTEGFTNSLKEIGYQGIRKDDLVIHAMDGFAGAIGVSDSDGKSTPVYSVCEPKDGSLSEYYGRLLRYMALSGFVDSLAKGVRERSTEFRWGDASVLPLPVPPKSEQGAIVQFLDRETAKIDALVAEQERLIALLKEKRQAVISHAVTKGLDPDAPMKDSDIEWLGEIPAHWEVRTLKSLVERGVSISYGIVQPGENVEDGVPFIQTTNMSSGNFDLSILQRTNAEIAAAYPRSTLRPDDVVLGIRASIGAAHLVPKELAGANLSRGVARIQCGDEIHPQYLVACLGSGSTERYWQLCKQGSTFNEVSIQTVKKLKIAVPPKNEQEEIVQHCQAEQERFTGILAAATGFLAIIRERRAALISAAVTGKIDVRGLVEQQEMEAA